MIRFLQFSRTVSSALRTFIYGAVTWLFSMNPSQAVTLVDGFLIGAILADFVTWFIMTLMLLPSNIWHGIYDTFINLMFAWLIYNYFTPNLELDQDTYVIACLSFLLVAGLKVTFYSVKQIEKIFLNDDE